MKSINSGRLCYPEVGKSIENLFSFLLENIHQQILKFTVKATYNFLIN